MALSRTFCLTLLLIYSGWVSGQSLLGTYDSVPAIKKSRKQETYSLTYPGFREVRIDMTKPRAYSPQRKGQFFGGMLTLLTGLETGGKDTLMWMLPQSIGTGYQELDWLVEFFCVGEMEKTRERIRNDDGSVSLDTKKHILLDWTHNAVGLIEENGEGIGAFKIVQNLETKEDLWPWKEAIKQQAKAAKVPEITYKMGQINFSNFALVGKFRERELLVVVVGDWWRSLILLDGKPLAIFQSDNDPLLTKKDQRVQPYVLLDKTAVQERRDLIRLAMVSRVAMLTLSKSEYHK